MVESGPRVGFDGRKNLDILEKMVAILVPLFALYPNKQISGVISSSFQKHNNKNRLGVIS